ncbi:MAG: extracellular solute-binding protein [Sphaerochaetaceae bacterium]|jgi:putative aldouronate transport system substrate-binding protein
MKRNIMVLVLLVCLGSVAFSNGAKEERANSQTDDNRLITITWMRSENPAQPLNEENKCIEMIEKALNVRIDLQLVPASDWATKKSVILASNDMPDVMQGLTVDDLRKYGATGMFVNLLDYPDDIRDYLNIVQASDREEATRNFLVDGGMYAFQGLEYNRIDIASIPAIRMDLLKESNLSVPQSWDELYKDLLIIKQKHPDMYGFSTRNGTTYMIGQYAFELGSGGYPTFSKSGMYFEPTSKTWVYGPTSAGFMHVIQFLANSYKDKLLYPDYATMNKSDEFEKLSNGTLMMVTDNNSFVGRVYNPNIKGKNPDAYFDILKPMKNPNSTQRALRYEHDWTDDFVAISADTKYPERVVKAINWFYTETGRMVTNFGEEGVDYTMDNGTPTVNQALIEKHANDSDVFSGIQGDLGVGLLGLGLYVDESLYAQVSDPIMISEGKLIRQWTKDGLIEYNKSLPNFTTEEQQRITQLQNNIENTFMNEIDLFITGKTPLSKWPDFVKELQGQGTEELEKLYNDAYQRLLK